MPLQSVDLQVLGFSRFDTAHVDRSRIQRTHPSVDTFRVIGVAGLSRNGLAEVARCLRSGLHVVAYDVDDIASDAVRSGEVEMDFVDRSDIDRAMADGRCTVVDSPQPLAGCDAVLICDPIASDEMWPNEFHSLRFQCHQVARYCGPGKLIVLMAPAFVGATRELLTNVFEFERGLVAGRDVFIAHAPGGADGPALPGLLDAGVRAVGGTTSECARRAALLFGRRGQPLQVLENPEAAELVGLLQQTFHSVNTTLLGDFAEMCRGVGLDVEQLLGTPIEPTLDDSPPLAMTMGEPSQRLLWQLRASSRPSPMLERAVASIGQRAAVIVDRVVEVLHDSAISPQESKVFVVGGSASRGRGETGLSATVNVIEELLNRGAAVSYWDEHVRELEMSDGRIVRCVDDSLLSGYREPQAVQLGLDGIPAPANEESINGTKRPASLDEFDLVLVLSLPSYGEPSWLEDAPRVLDATYRITTVRHTNVV